METSYFNHCKSVFFGDYKYNITTTTSLPSSSLTHSTFYKVEKPENNISGHNHKAYIMAINTETIQ